MNTLTAVNKILLIAIPGLLILIACSNENADSELDTPLRPVRTIEVSNQDIDPTRDFPATVDASRKANLSFKIAGEVHDLLVKQGDDVQKGQVIAKINDRDVAIQVRESQSNYDKTKGDFDRALTLIKTNHISQAEFDQLKAQFKSAQAKLESAKNNLTYTSLTAPFDGVIAKTHIQKFEEVNAKQTIVTLHDLSNINLKVEIPESIMIRLKKDNKPKHIVAIFSAIKDTPFPLSFKEISTEADDITKNYEATFSMQAPANHIILPGMTAIVQTTRMMSDFRKNSFYLPPATVLKDSEGNFVWTVLAKEKGIGIIERNPVTIGEITPMGMEVYSGLEEGQHIVSAGMSKVSAGLTVKF